MFTKPTNSDDILWSEERRAVCALEGLVGRTALVHPTTDGKRYAAQFTQCGNHVNVESCTSDCLTIGWWMCDAAAMVIVADE